jgi:hypothetical protein
MAQVHQCWLSPTSCLLLDVLAQSIQDVGEWSTLVRQTACRMTSGSPLHEEVIIVHMLVPKAAAKT